MSVAENILDERQHQLRFFDAYVASLDPQRRVPRVVVERLGGSFFPATCAAEADRGQCVFVENHPSLAEVGARAGLDDYRGSGYTRGHMAAAGNNRCAGQTAMCETFILSSNIVPQEAVNNGDYWFRMEVLARRNVSAACGAPGVFVLSGPLFLPEPVATDPDAKLSRFRHPGPKRYLWHEVLGNGVAVPTHLFKAFVSEDEAGKPVMSAFVVPNGPVKGDVKLSDFAVSREALQEMVGFHVLPHSDSVLPLCGNLLDCDASLMNDTQYDTYMLGRRLGWAKSLSDLERTWERAARDGVVVDEHAQSVYETKRKALKPN